MTRLILEHYSRVARSLHRIYTAPPGFGRRKVYALEIASSTAIPSTA
jgi:hypothetical protein